MNRKLLTLVLSSALGVSAVAQEAGGTPPAAAPAAPAPAPAASNAPAPTKIGIVDIQAVILATNEGRRDFEGLQKKFEPRQNELQKVGQEIEELRKQLQTQGDKLNDQARSSMVRDIENKQKSLQRQAEDAQTDFQGQRDEIAGRILQKLGPVLSNYAEKGNYAVILDASQPWPQGQVVWAAEPVDVTEAVVELYNQQSGVAAAPAAPSATPRPNAPAPKPPAQ